MILSLAFQEEMMARESGEQSCEPPALSATPEPVIVEPGGRKETLHDTSSPDPSTKAIANSCLTEKWPSCCNQVPNEPVETMAPKKQGDLFTLARSILTQ